jgi:hypothetical protein
MVLCRRGPLLRKIGPAIECNVVPVTVGPRVTFWSSAFATINDAVTAIMQGRGSKIAMFLRPLQCLQLRRGPIAPRYFESQGRPTLV